MADALFHHGIWKPVRWFYVMKRYSTGRGYLFSLDLPKGWKIEGASRWWAFELESRGIAFGPFWIGRPNG